MVRWLSRFFHYLDRYFISRRSLTPLKEVGLTCFRELVKQPSLDSQLLFYALVFNVHVLMNFTCGNRFIKRLKDK